MGSSNHLDTKIAGIFNNICKMSLEVVHYDERREVYLEPRFLPPRRNLLLQVLE